MDASRSLKPSFFVQLYFWINKGSHGKAAFFRKLRPIIEPRVLPRPFVARQQRNGYFSTFLYGGLLSFPVVKAWSPFGSSSSDEYEKLPNGQRLRLMNRKDAKLKKDIIKADELYASGNITNYEEAYLLLNCHKAKAEPELHWRIARLLYEKSKLAKSSEEKRKLIEDAYKLVSDSLEIDEKIFAAHKWTAILLNEVSTIKGIKEQISQSLNVKKHMMRATELNPDDATNIHLLGYWCYSVADIPWYQKKIAETLFAKPPECSFQEAYQYFLQAELTEPGFYSKNLVMLAKSCIHLGDMDKAEQYLLKLKKIKPTTEDDFLAKTEGKQLREKYFKANTSNED